ncbi:MAG: 3-oxoacyl-[acyl-carrier-protein] reductase [Leptospiraceae bacterium]|nr:3-oxoacyl-[acyl-carrier-protein] reductase [Leptospiraceae bacterium]MBK7053989.1 3-oxoacyl-[acyl-carrier-protein] reductase [Leptospiraceae bacterium]MBK9499887.1 3-oxoacyl-[acyl-carrier-protein] reductase [Leptospiraceae bacterium]MBL0262553.1 3-oxoacyl-[acyl-carrier-protein] reductase [Leptospiraceae bacterium]MBP9163745.1 3-oxoacyl-[acyl-carrier-protein] reductase [Leptospiraceae bacterium]
MIDFKNKSVIITGSARGIGKAIALKFGGLGANLVIVDMNEEATKATAEELKGLGYKAIAVTCNVTKEEDCAAMIDATVKEFGSVDVLINNAGITKDTLLMRMKKEQWDAVIAVNLTGTYNATQAAIKTMMKQKSGNIINLTSIVGIDGNAGQTNYAASKAGVIGFTKACAKEFASRGIRVNAIAPGFIETDMTAAIPEAMREGMKKAIYLGRTGKPDDIAGAAAFLASDAASYITGVVLEVSGGGFRAGGGE